MQNSNTAFRGLNLRAAISLSTSTLMVLADNSVSKKGVQQKGSPFLITGKLPHLTKILINEWDNTELALSAAQKVELLAARKETIANVQALGKKIAPLEKQVAEEIFDQKSPDEFYSLVETIAGLKTEATRVLLRCIYNTRKTLEEKQLTLLLDL